MYTKISVLIPTRRRPQRLRTVLESYARTTASAPACSELLFRIDDDDPESLAALEGQRVLVGPRLKGYDSLPVFFNEMASALATGDVFLCGNDDMVFRTDGWAPAVLALANQYPDGIFDIGVKSHNEAHYPWSIVSRKACAAMGFLWDPRIFWGDIFLRDVMAHFGRTVMLPSVEIEHDWAGYKPDAVFKEADKDIVRRHPMYWTETHARAVHDAVERLSTLITRLEVVQ